MKKFIIALFLLMGVIFVLARVAELNNILAVLQRGNLFFLLLAVALGVVWLISLSAQFQSIYYVLGMAEKRSRLFLLVTAANFVNVIAPSGGLSGLAIFLAEAQRVGRSKASVTIAGVLYVWFEYIGTLTILVIGLGELAYRNNLNWEEITASLILVAGALGIALLLYLGMHSDEQLGRVLVLLSRVVNAILRPFLRRAYLDEEYARFFAQEVAEGVKALHNNPRWAFRPFLIALLNKAMLCLVLAACFLAFEVPLDPGTVVAGISIGHLFLIVSPTPSGIGIVEGVMALSLKSLGVPMSDSAVITIAYRSMTFWMPFLIGMATVRRLGYGSKPVHDKSEEKTLQSL